MKAPKHDWSFLFQTDDPVCVAVERGLFCLVLGMVAKFVIDVPILQWIMLFAGSGYIAYGIAYGMTHIKW